MGCLTGMRNTARQMKRIILYRYYHKFDCNKELLKFLKYLNPDVNIYGLYGGPEDKFKEASECLNGFLAHNFLIKGKDTDWKWKNGDMTYQLWYNEYGHKVDFDIMHAVEWDLLYFEPLDKLFAHIPKDTLALTGLIPLWMIRRKWYWTNNKDKIAERKLLMDYFKKNFDYSDVPYGMLGPGTSLPRVFLEKIKNIDIPYLSVDEIRFPMFAQVFGINMMNTGFYKKWFSLKEFNYFNSDSYDIDLQTIKSQLKKRNGRRVFHPYREHISFEQLVDLYHSIPAFENSVVIKLSDVLYNIREKVSLRVEIP